MLKFLTNNLGMKILALVIAVGLWVFVAASMNTVTKFPGSIAVKAVNIPENYSAIYDTKEVSLKVAADPSVWKQLSSENFSAFVDLNGLSVGTHSLKVIVNANLSNVQIVEVDPTNIMVRLEPVAKKTVNINAQISGQAADGLTTGDINFTPDKVEISGPKSLVDLVSSATVSIKLNSETEGFSRDVSVAALNDKGEVIADITTNPATVKADVKIVKAGKSKTVGIKVVTTGMPASGFYVSNLVTDPLTIDIVGQDSIIRPIQYIETSPVDISGLTDNLTKNVTLNLPAGVSLQQNAVQKVKITVTMAPNQISRELSGITINPQNLASGKASYNPATIKVVVSGPAAIVNALTPTDIILNLDLSGKAPGAAQFGIDLVPSTMFKAPAGVIVTTSVPSSISVNISQ